MEENGNQAARPQDDVACLVVADRSSEEGRRLVRISGNPNLPPQGPLWSEVVPRVVVELMGAPSRYVCAFAISSKGSVSGSVEVVVTDNLLDLEYATLPRMTRSIPQGFMLDMQLSLSPVDATAIRDVVLLAAGTGLVML